ncbi:MAG: EamA family transporter [Glaciihabitans sp.]|nr:EamA family transporter [Glaciihabitans sp.]
MSDSTGISEANPSSSSTSRSTRQRITGVATLLGSALSSQLGAAVGSLAFPVIGPVGVVAVRQFVAAIVLIPIARPRIHTYWWGQWWPILLLALIFGIMNLSLYSAIERIGLGLAVTLEFLGPLSIALLVSRSRYGALCALVAAVGVVAITNPEASTDFLGVGLGLLAALCWACYILLNRTVGRRIAGAGGSATAAGVSAVVFIPIAIANFGAHQPTVTVLLFAVVAGVFSSAVPYIADLSALRRVPAQLFGILMSVNPIFAAIVGAVFLAQSLEVIEWVGVLLIVGANGVALLRRAPRTDA